MPGDEWQKFANLRLLYGYMFSQPGKKLLFMGSAWGKGGEWNHDRSLDWHELDNAHHAGVLKWLTDLHRVYKSEPALHQLDCDPAGFEWVDANDASNSVLSYLRKSREGAQHQVLIVCNFT